MKTEGRIRSVLMLAGKNGLTSKEIGDITDTWPGTLYPKLHKMEQEEIIRSDWDDGPKPRTRRYWFVGEKDDG